MTCMEMCGSVAGIGMAIILQGLRQIIPALVLALTAFYAAVAGSVRPRILILSFGVTPIPLTGKSMSAFGWCAPEFCEY